MAGNEPDVGLGSIASGGSGGIYRAGKRAVAGRIAAKVTADGVRKLTADFSGLLKVLKEVRSELTAINKAASAGGGGGVGQGTPTGAAGTQPAGGAANIIGNVTQALPSGGGGGPTLPTSAVRGAGGFNYGAAGMALYQGASAIQGGLNLVSDRFSRNVIQSAPISSMDVRTASMYGPELYKEMERTRYNAGRGTSQFLGGREPTQAAQGIALSFGSTMAGSQQFMPQVGAMIQASGGAMNAAQAAAQVGNFASPMVSNRARALGIMSYKDNGILNNPNKVALDYVKDYEKRNGVTMNEIDFSNLQSPSSGHRMRMKQLYGLSDEAIDMVVAAGMQNMQFRQTKGSGGRDINFSSGEDLSKLGLNTRNSLGLAAARLNTTSERREARFFGNNESDMTQRLASENLLQEALSDTEQAFGNLLGPMHEFERILKGITSIMGAAGGALMVGGMFGLGGGGGGGGGLLGALRGLTGGGGGGPGGQIPGQMQLPGMGAPGVAGKLATAARVGGGALAVGGVAMGTYQAATADSAVGAGVGILGATASGAIAGQMLIPVPGVGAAIGAGIGFGVSSAFAAKNYFAGVDKKNVEQGYDVGVGMTDKALIDSLGDYVKNAANAAQGGPGRGGKGRGQGAGAKQRGRFDAFAQRRGTLLAAALDAAQNSGLLKPATTAEASELADLVMFFSSTDVFSDEKLWSNKQKAEPFVSKIRSSAIWKEYFGSLSDPFAYTPNNTAQSQSLIMTPEAAYAAGTGQESTGDGAFAATGMDPWHTGDAVDDKVASKGDTWNKLDSRMKERLLKMFRASGGRVWLGNGWRSSTEQERMFRDRYVPDPGGSIEWNGQRWRHVKGAAAAPPGRSMHEIGMAADLEGDMGWMNAHAAEFQLKHFANVNNENWHVQPAEFPNSRREFEAGGGASDSSGGGTGTAAAPAAAPQSFGGGGGGAVSGIGYSMAAAAGATSAGGGALEEPTAPGATPGAGGGGGSIDFGGDDTARAVAAAKAAHTAGFTGQALINMVAIAGRESSWTPSAHRSDRDKSLGLGDRGLWQINYVNDPGLKAAGIISTWRDLLDPVINARAAYRLSGGGSNLGPWTAGAGGWQAGGNPFYGTDLEHARKAVEQAGLSGDAAFDPGLTMTAPTGGGNANVSINVTITSTGNVRYDAQALGDAVRPVLTNVMAEISTKRGS